MFRHPVRIGKVLLLYNGVMKGFLAKGSSGTGLMRNDFLTTPRREKQEPL
jgi:hypothetical protein